MNYDEIHLRFEGLSAAEASTAAQRLQQMLTDAEPGLQVTLARGSANAQDMGATLVLLLGTPAVVMAAKGIAAFLAKRGERGGDLVIERVHPDGSGERIHFNGASADAARIAEALRGSGDKS